jgi:putative MATE family efflux protein
MRIAWPVVVGNLIETFYNLTDAFFLGKLGASEISAPSISFSIMMFLIVLGTGLSGAGTTLIAQAKGRSDPERMNHYLNQMTTFLVAASLLIMAFGLLISRPLLALLQTPGEVMGFTLGYLRICLCGIPFTFMYYILQAAFIAVGDSFTPLWVHLVAVLLNAILDPLLIFGPGPFPALGVAGAAIATIGSQAVAAAFSLAILMKGKHGLRLSRAELKPRGDTLRLFMQIGLPSSIGQALSSLGFTVLQGLVNSFGTAAIAAFGVGNRVTSLFDVPARGVASAATTLAGQALGSGDRKEAGRVVRVCLWSCVAFLTPLLVVSFFAGGDIVRLFVDNPEAMRLGDIMFKIVSPSVFMFGLYLVVTGAFQGAGATKVIMFLAILRLWGTRVPLAYLLALTTRLGPVSIWYAMFVSNSLTAIIGFIYYRRGPWMSALAGKKI